MSDLITNQMKAECIGEFSFTREAPCPKCSLHLQEHYDNVECLCDGDGTYFESYDVPWDTCKEIYKKMLKNSPIPERMERMDESLDKANTQIERMRERVNKREATLIQTMKELEQGWRDKNVGNNPMIIARTQGVADGFYQAWKLIEDTSTPPTDKG